MDAQSSAVTALFTGMESTALARDWIRGTERLHCVCLSPPRVLLRSHAHQNLLL